MQETFLHGHFLSPPVRRLRRGLGHGRHLRVQEWRSRATDHADGLDESPVWRGQFRAEQAVPRVP